ncbi:Modification methylase PaeR7I [compost metagenome]
MSQPKDLSVPMLPRPFVPPHSADGSASLLDQRRSGDPRSEARKPRSSAEALGQVFTDSALAERMVRNLRITPTDKPARILDPCVGPFTFPAVFARAGATRVQLDAFDIDPEMCRVSSAEGLDAPFECQVRCADYLLAPCEAPYDFAVLNPPYVRQEWIRDKALYREHLGRITNARVPGTSNLYVYFIVKVLAELKAGGRLACIVYDSWQSTLYGRWLTNHLDANCSSWRCEPAPSCPFDGKLIDATIIYAEKGDPTGVSTPAPAAVIRPGRVTIDTAFRSARGLRLKQTDFFMTTLERAAVDGATPFVKKIGRIQGYGVEDDHPEAALLLSASEGDARTTAALQKRLEQALVRPEANVSVLTWRSERPTAWNQHKPAPRAPLLFNYYLRHRPRHVMNSGWRAYSDNFYGIVPHDDLPLEAWLAALNATVSAVGFLRQARNQGAGLAKLQLFEYRAAEVLDIRQWGEADLRSLAKLGETLLAKPARADYVIRDIDILIADVVEADDLDPRALAEELREVDQIAKSPRATST